MGRFNVIILGAGSTGSSIAFHLAKKGETKVLVLDKSCIGCGQTSRSSALIRLHYTNPIIREMAVYSWRFFRERFQDETGCEHSIFTQTGIGFGGSEEHTSTMEEVVRSLRTLGVETQLYDPEEFKKEVFRGINTNGLAIIAWEPLSGYGDPHTIVRCFIEYARKAGIEVKEHTPAKRLVIKDNLIEGVETTEGFFKAEFIVNAMGVWANRLLEPARLKLPIKIGREEVLLLKNPPDLRTVPPGWGDLSLGFYSRPEGKVLTLVGGLDVDYPEMEPEPGDYAKPPMRLIKKRAPTFTKRFPIMEKAMPYSGWYGFYDITPDWQPIIGKDHRVENLIHMVGLSGHGFKLSPAYGDVISDIILYGKAKRFRVEEFSINRFEEGITKHSKYKYGIVG